MNRVERIQQEVDMLNGDWCDIAVDQDLRWLVLENVPLPAGWNMSHTWVLILIPPGYPTTPPDNFYTDPALRLADGQQPAKTNLEQRQAERRCLMFSVHVEKGDWNPGASPADGHNLATFVSAALKRLAEVD